MKRIIKENINTAEHFDQFFKKNFDVYDSYKNIVFYDKLLGSKMFRGASYLDFGCAGGTSLAKIKEKFPTLSVIGVDISAYCIEANKEKFPVCSFYTDKDFFQTDFSVDNILSSHTIEHLENPIETIKYLLGRTKSSVLVIVPYQDSWRGEEHLWTFDEKSFISLNPTLACKGLANESKNTELIFYWKKEGQLVIPKKLISARIALRNFQNQAFRYLYGKVKFIKRLIKHEDNRPTTGKK